jgi:ribosomal protein L11 methyltransferase
LFIHHVSVNKFGKFSSSLVEIINDFKIKMLKNVRGIMYKQLTIYVNDESVEILTDLFFDFGALATTICDANEGNADEELIFDEPVGLLSVKKVPVWKHSIIYVLFLQEDDINQIILEIYSILGMQFEYTESILEDQNWGGQ